jgi:alpha-tubulin suppressor-like RCC1 family protein
VLRGGRVGTTDIVANYGGFSARARVTVTPFEWGSIVAGERHVCGLGVDGTAYCWGSNDNGQLGDGTFSLVNPEPIPVSGGYHFASIAPGGLQTCGVLLTGAALCWGRGYTTGNGTFNNTPVPLPVSGGLTWEMLDMGIFHVCGVATGGAAFCWGYGGDGRLGTGDGAWQSVPTAVQGGHVFMQVSAGQDHSCGVTTAGDAYCWGIGLDGRLGDGTAAPSPVPVLVEGGYDFVRVSAGGAHSCGLTGAGRALCWGRGDLGQLGGGSTEGSLVPRLVSDELTFVSLDVGAHHACAATAGGAAYCWGYGASGQLGNGQLPEVQAEPVEVLGSLSFATVTASGSPWSLEFSDDRGTSCGLTQDALAYCWGSNNVGQVGDGTTLLRNVPAAVRDP